MWVLATLCSEGSVRLGWVVPLDTPGILGRKLVWGKICGFFLGDLGSSGSLAERGRGIGVGL